MALTEEQREIALRIAEQFRASVMDRRVYFGMGADDLFFVIERFLAALPKPEQAGALKELGKRLAARLDEDDWNYIEPFLRECEAPIAPPASECKCSMTTKLVGDGCAHCNPEYAASAAQPASEQKPVAWATTNEDGDYAMLFFDQQEARNYSGDDEPIGLALISSSAPQPDYKAQLDALMELLEQAGKALESMVQYSQDSHDEPPFPASALDYEAYQLSCEIVSAIASAKGGA